ncbi:hypothetical protein [Acinetobacter sp. P8-3-8]|uniref:hypothetical protein n=1 Tax=Acinetobacter sp. P8-3-8 TaxID=1029823 RepID=UPI00024869FA|nr:hypothetical protein [Acinetobacter sp. P8-3-8]
MNKINYKRIFSSLICYVLILQQSHAFSINGWEPLKTAEQIITAPTKTIINTAKVIVEGKNPETILDPTKDLIKAHAPIPAAVSEITTWPQTQIYKEARKVVAKSGSGGELIFDVATFYDNYQAQIIKSSGQVATNTLLGQDPMQILAMPLAAAIREAQERHIANAKPLPKDVKDGLASLYSKEVLDSARYVIGDIEFTLPNGIGKAHKFMGKEIAVVVGNVIVFSTDPGGLWNNPFWWGHELKHVEQYSKWGIEEFALRYVKNYTGNVENPADDAGSEALTWALNNQKAYNQSMTVLASQSHINELTGKSKPLLPNSGLQKLIQPNDPVVVQFFFFNDSPIFEYYGTQSGKIVVKDSSKNIWMQIGWAIPPDIQGPSWIYFIPNKGSYDVFANGAIMMRYSHVGSPIQVGYVAQIQP